LTRFAAIWVLTFSSGCVHARSTRKLQWDLTLSLGGLPSMPAGLVCEENLVKLLRLEWFRSGSMPDELRRELISQLDSKVEREVRESIVRILETSPAPAETFAATRTSVPDRLPALLAGSEGSEGAARVAGRTGESRTRRDRAGLRVPGRG
jgi:hypothetical protein